MPDTGSIRVLIAEDDDNARALLVDLLNTMGHVVVAEVTGGREAIERAKDVVPDVVLLDVHMPDGSGIEAAEQIAKEVPGVAVVLFSGDQTLTLSEREVAATAAIAFLPKPTPPRVLDSTLRLAVERAREFSSAKKDAAAARGALENRKTIERAKGILMRRTGSSEQEAYRILQRTSQDRSVPMVEIARGRAGQRARTPGEREGQVSAARRVVVALVAAVAGALGCARSPAPVTVATTSATAPATAPARVASRPAIFVAGNSTAARGAGERQQGWAVPFADYFDTTKVSVVNRARGGRSSRTFVTEGLWERLIADVRPGDVVLIEFGHNDGGAINDTLRARGSIPGLGDDSVAIDNLITKRHEVVHTFGWYMRKMIAETKAKGATPIVLSLSVRNLWRDGQIERGSGRYGAWSAQLAREAGVRFIDLTNLVADSLQRLGPERTKAMYVQDYVHFNAQGADLHARTVVSALKALRPSPVRAHGCRRRATPCGPTRSSGWGCRGQPIARARRCSSSATPRCATDEATAAEGSGDGGTSSRRCSTRRRSTS